MKTQPDIKNVSIEKEIIWRVIISKNAIPFEQLKELLFNLSGGVYR